MTERNPDPRVQRPMRRLSPTQIGLIITGLLILAFAIWTAASTRRGNPDRLDTDKPEASRTVGPEQRCASQPTYDLIKRELFRRAASVRGGNQAMFDKLAAYAVVRVDRPLVASDSAANGAVECTGSLTLALPPGVAVAGGRRTLVGDIGYSVQRSADGNGQVLTLNDADAIVNPLATVARAAQAPVNPMATGADQDPPSASPPSYAPQGAAPYQSAPPPAQRPPLAPPPPMAVPRPIAPAPPAARPQASVRPSFNCAYARTRGERAVCSDPGLAALDRQMAAQYRSAIAASDPGTRAQLERSRGRFLSFRDQCPSNDCIADTYRGRMREIGDIAEGR